ncbi:MAG: 50S rRNA methyltransferase, partial [Butyricicoccus pullicaecorum]
LFELPLADASVDLVLHLFAPMCAEEFARVLRPGGTLLTVTPGARHLWGMKEVLYQKPYENPTEIRELPGLTFEREVCVEDTITLSDPQDIAALYQMTPYAWKTPKEAADRLLHRDALTTPISFQIHLYRKG